MIFYAFFAKVDSAFSTDVVSLESCIYISDWTIWSPTILKISNFIDHSFMARLLIDEYCNKTHLN